MERPTKDEMYMEMAQAAAKRSACGRLRVGAVIVDPLLGKVISIGYNGPEKNGPNACRGVGEGMCGCLHAELNALIKADQTMYKTMYVTHSPCVMCAGYIVNAKISRIVYDVKYRLDAGIQLLGERGIEIAHL